jgi:hypothetical protein
MLIIFDILPPLIIIFPFPFLIIIVEDDATQPLISIVLIHFHLLLWWDDRLFSFSSSSFSSKHLGQFHHPFLHENLGLAFIHDVTFLFINTLD